MLGRLKLSDFGLACQIMPGESMSELWGTPSYMAPELWPGASAELDRLRAVRLAVSMKRD